MVTVMIMGMFIYYLTSGKSVGNDFDHIDWLLKLI